jgi:3-phenylpropionate/cinnamic acid dioxygenase small subunit
VKSEIDPVLTDILAQVQHLTDESDIHRLIDQYGAALDEKRWDDWENTFSNDVVTEYPWGRNEGKSGMGKKAGDLLADFVITEHLSGNVLIDIEGDRASSRRNVWIICVREDDVPGVHFTEGGVYTCEHVRTPDGWKFSYIRLDIKWTINGGPL